MPSEYNRDHDNSVANSAPRGLLEALFALFPSRLNCTGARVRAPVHTQEVGGVNVRIALGGRQGLMTKLFLNRANIRTARKHVGCTRMAKSVRMHMGDPALVTRSIDNTACGAVR